MPVSTDCLFCRIVAGEIPARLVHSDETAIAFLDVAPFHRGHTLVVPRAHSADLLDGTGVLAGIAPAVEATAHLLRERLRPSGINVLSNLGADAGQSVFHTHVHLIPRYPELPGMEALLTRDAAADELDAVLAEILA